MLLTTLDYDRLIENVLASNMNQGVKDILRDILWERRKNDPGTMRVLKRTIADPAHIRPVPR